MNEEYGIYELVEEHYRLQWERVQWDDENLDLTFSDWFKLNKDNLYQKIFDETYVYLGVSDTKAEYEVKFDEAVNMIIY